MQCEYYKADTLDAAVLLASQHPKSMFLAGGTDLLVNQQQGNVAAGVLIDISGVKVLHEVSVQGNILTLGSMITLSYLSEQEEIKKYFPSLITAIGSVATPVIRQTATLGGNLLCDNRCSFYNQSEWWRKAVGYCLKCNGDVCIATGGKKNCFSKFVSDTAPVLIALGAQVSLLTAGEMRQIPLENLYSGNGVNPHAKPSDTLLTFIHLNTDIGARVEFRKLRPRKTLDFTSLTTALAQYPDGRLRAVIGGVDPRPVMIEGNVHENPEAFIALCAKKPRIVDNDFYSRNYRKEMITHFIKDSLQKLNP